MGAPTTWAEKMALIRQVKPAEVTCQIVVDQTLARKVDQAAARLQVARARALHRLSQHTAPDDTSSTDVNAAVDADPEVAAAVTALDIATRERDAATVEFTFRALPSEVYYSLKDEHPPTEDEQKRGKRVHDATFAPAIIAACHVDKVRTGTDDNGEPTYDEGPGMTVEDAEEILSRWSAADASTLYSAAVAVNEVSRVDYGALGKGSGPTTG